MSISTMAQYQDHFVPENAVQLGIDPKMANTGQPIVIMVPTPAPVKQKVSYNEVFPKIPMIVLNSVQLLMATLAIVTQVVGIIESRHGFHIAGAGIWCGIFFLASGTSGMVASCYPSFASIVTNMVFAIVSALFCLPLLVFSSFGTAFGGYGYSSSHAANIMFPIQIAISLIQAISAIMSSAMTCRAICPCCKTSTESKVKQPIRYHETFPKQVIVVLGSIQLIMALVGIITESVGLSDNDGYRMPFLGTGIWCGILFGVSGGTGIIAGLRPAVRTIIPFMVLSIIAATFCLPLLVISSIGTAETKNYYRYNYTNYYSSYNNYHNSQRSKIYDYKIHIKHAMFAIQIVVSLIQLMAAIPSSVFTCINVCSCCRSNANEENGNVYYSNTTANSANNVSPQQGNFVSQQPGYVTIPLSQIQQAVASSGGITSSEIPPRYSTLPNQPKNATHTEAGANSASPEKDFINFDEENVDLSKYHRFT